VKSGMCSSSRAPNLFADRKQKENSKDCDGPVTIRHRGFQFVTDCNGSVTNYDNLQNCDGISVTIFEASVTIFTPLTCTRSSVTNKISPSQYPSQIVMDINSVTI